jgi:hypothetical protein
MEMKLVVLGGSVFEDLLDAGKLRRLESGPLRK